MNAKALLPIVALTALWGCGNSPETAKTEPGKADPGKGETQKDQPAAAKLKVALLTPGPVNDAGWSALAYDGLLAIQKDLGAEVANQEASGANIKDAMRSYAQHGYNLVIGHGFEYNEFGINAAKDFPKTVFVSTSGSGFSKNAGAIRFYLEEGCYLAGYLAGKTSKTGKVGSVAVQNYPSIVSTITAYEAGALAANPKIKIIPTVYFGKEGDVAAAKQATASVISSGADFVIHQANAAAPGVFNACKEKGVYALGTNADQNANDSGAVIASATIVARPAFLDLAKQVAAGTYQGSVQLFGMDKGAIDFIVNPKLQSKVSPETLKAIEDLKAKIKSGALVVPKAKF